MSAAEDDKLDQALEAFEGIMAHRSDMYLRLSQRVRYVVRGGMVVFGAVGLAMFLLLYTLVSQINHAKQSALKMEVHVARVAEDMQRVQQVIGNLEDRFTLMSAIGGNMTSMTRETGVMSEEMNTLTADMNTIQGQMRQINSRLGRISGTMGHMGHAMNGMGASMNQISRPAGMFNMFPMP